MGIKMNNFKETINLCFGKSSDKKPETETEEWIWVEGYKGTDKNMICRDHQFELDKQYDIPEDKTVMDCLCGFHFCRDLKDVFGYYELTQGNRFFKVKGLVRKSDYEAYGYTKFNPYYAMTYEKKDKLAAKSIVLVEELSLDEIVDVYKKKYTDDTLLSWTEDDWKLAINVGVDGVWSEHRVAELMGYGYSEQFSRYIDKRLRENKGANMYHTAVAVGSQEGLSMDLKVMFIMNVMNAMN